MLIVIMTDDCFSGLPSEAPKSENLPPVKKSRFQQEHGSRATANEDDDDPEARLDSKNTYSHRIGKGYYIVLVPSCIHRHYFDKHFCGVYMAYSRNF